VDTDAGRADTFEQIESYDDAAPRSSADTEAVGRFTLFVGRGAWGSYARPTLGSRGEIGADDDLAPLLSVQQQGSIARTSAFIAAKASRSASRNPRSTRRAVVRCGTADAPGGVTRPGRPGSPPTRPRAATR